MGQAELRDKVLHLGESLRSSRARVTAQSEMLERLGREIAELRALVDKPLPAPARTSPVRSAPLVKEPAADSAPAAASFRKGAGWDSWRPVPYIAIFFVAAAMHLRASRPAAPVVRTPLPAAAPAPTDLDGGADEALLLAHDWRLPGDERPLSERLGSDMNPPGTRPEWTAERTGERTYRVTFRAIGSDADYDFDVDLSARRVDPTPETAELISPRLVSRR